MSYQSLLFASAAEPEDDNLKPWEEEDFVPRTSSGKQKSPNQIRGELQRLIDSSSKTQTSFMEKMGVNSQSL